MRKIKRVHDAVPSPIGDLITYRALPTRSIDYIDPFLFLNHHGPQVYPKNNHGLPFGPHPHRGMETVTFIIEGDIMHKDSSGHESIITAGGVQWMTAGSGLIHAEVSSESFKRQGGPLEILQLWVNLPARLKMTKPFYKGLQENEITTINVNDSIRIQLIAGAYKDYRGNFQPESGITLMTVHAKANTSFSIDIPENHSIFFYVIRGRLEVSQQKVKALQLVEFEYQPGNLNIQTEVDSIIIIGHSKPLAEPVVAQGPFVMNTQQEIMQAYEDYRNGKFGAWNHD